MDFKERMGISLMVALVIGILTYSLISPIATWYLGFVPGLISCQSADWGCIIVVPIISFGLPIMAIFLCVASVFEAFMGGK
jgi:hypothetical protein